MDFTCPVGTVTRSEQCQCLSTTFSLPFRHLFTAFSCLFTRENRCYRCPEHEYSPAAGASCRPCPPGETNNALTSACQCKPNYFATANQPKCFESDFTLHTPFIQACMPLAKSDLELCVEEAAGPVLLLKAGWFGLTQPDGTYSIFLCRNGDACPKQEANSGYGENCTEGHIAPLCSVCHEDFALDGEGGCNRCNETTVQGVLVIIVCIILVVIGVMMVKKWYHTFTAFADIAEALMELELQAITKMLIATLQIVGGLAAGLNVTFPAVFTSFIREVASAFRFDIAGIFTTSLGIGCALDGTFFPALTANICLVGGIMLLELVHFKWEVAHIEKNAAKLTEAENKMRVRRIYDRFDLDGDGVSLEEVILIVKSIDPNIPPEQVKDLFDEADADNGGGLSFEEFFNAVTEPPDSNEKRKRSIKSLGRKQAQKLNLGILVKKQQRAETKASAAGRIFLLAFLLYPGLSSLLPVLPPVLLSLPASTSSSMPCLCLPSLPSRSAKSFSLAENHGLLAILGLTAKIFDSFACRRLGIDVEVLLVDYTVDCTSPWYISFVVTIGPALVCGWPIGLPAFLLFRMFRALDKIKSNDEDTMAEFSFVLDDYKDTHW